MWGTGLLFATLSNVMPLIVTFEPTPDVRVLAATAGFAMLATLSRDSGRRWRVTRPDVLPDLKEQPADRGTGRRFTLSNALVVGQIAVSLALLTAAGLFMRGAFKASMADPGFPLDSGVVATLDPGMAGHDEARGRAAIRNILLRVRSIPGVHSASVASLAAIREFREGNLVQKGGTPPAPEGQRDVGVDATYTIVGADYFETLRLPLLRGRGFTAAEEEARAAPPVAIVDEPLARQLLGGEDPIGQVIQFRRNNKKQETFTVVGVVAGVRHDLFDHAPGPHVYVPFGQNYRGSINLHVRAARVPDARMRCCQTLRREIPAADATVPSARSRRSSSIVTAASCSGRQRRAPAVRDFRRRRAAARRRRRLRRPLVSRLPTDTGNRHPHGARRDIVQRDVADRQREPRPHGDRHCAWRAARIGASAWR